MTHKNTKIINQLNQRLIRQLGVNLVAIIRIGSAESKYFCESISDIDLFLVLNKVSPKVLIILSKIRQDCLKEFNIPLGFKIHTYQEFLLTTQNKTNSRFLNGFTLYRIKKGIWEIKYAQKTDLMKFSISKKRAKENAILNLLSRINNARMNIIEKDYAFHCGLRKQNKVDIMHWAVSRTFDVFWYSESMKGNILRSKWELTKIKNLTKMEIKALNELYSIRTYFKFNKHLLEEATNLTEDRLESILCEVVLND